MTVVVFVSWKRTNYFTSKKDISETWKNMITGARRSVLVFAGDISWAKRDKLTIQSLTNKGINFSVVCRRPRSTALLRSHVRTLIDAGAQVRYYDEADTPVVRGLVIDHSSPSSSTSLVVSKTPKPEIVSKTPKAKYYRDDRDDYGKPGREDEYDYRATRYITPEDLERINTLAQLFDGVWKTSLLGYLLNPTLISNSAIVELLKTVPHYRELGEPSVTLRLVDIGSLWATCNIIKDYKLSNTRALLDAYSSQGLRTFVPCTALSHVRRTILLPPIVEKHSDKFVVIDGMHRLYCLLAFQEQADAECIVISTDLELPSKLVPFSSVKLWPRKLPRYRSFQDFRPEYFRNIDLLDEALKDRFDDFDVTVQARQILSDALASRINRTELEFAFDAFQLAGSPAEMRQAVTEFPFMAGAAFMEAVAQVINQAVPPEQQPAFKQRLAWLRQIADEQ